VLPYMSSPVASTAAVVWCRLLALWMLGWGIQSSLIGLVQTIDYVRRYAFDAPAMTGIFLGSMITPSVWLILAWYCWAKAPRLAGRMVRGRAEDLSPRGMSADELLTTIMIGIGIYLLAEGLHVVAQWVYIGLARVRSGAGSLDGIDAVVVGSIVRCSLGLWLILGTQGILTIIRRHSGRWRDPAEPRA